MFSTELWEAASNSWTSRELPTAMAWQVAQWSQGSPSGQGSSQLIALARDASSGGLARTPRPGEEIGMGNPSLPSLPDQGIGYVPLPDHLPEDLRPVLAIKRLVLHVVRMVYSAADIHA